MPAPAGGRVWLSPSTRHRELRAEPAGLRLPLAPNISRREWQDFRLGWSALACPSVPAACRAPRQRLRNSEQRKWQPHVEPLLTAPRVTASPAGRASFPSGSREGKLPSKVPISKKAAGAAGTPSCLLDRRPRNLAGIAPEEGNSRAGRDRGFGRYKRDESSHGAGDSCYLGLFFGGVCVFLGNCLARVFCPAGCLLPCGYGKMFFSQKCLGSVALPVSCVTLPPALGSALTAFPQ